MQKKYRAWPLLLDTFLSANASAPPRSSPSVKQFGHSSASTPTTSIATASTTPWTAMTSPSPHHLPISQSPQRSSAYVFRFQVLGILTSFFAKENFPTFSVEIIQQNGQSLPRAANGARTKPVADVRFRLVLLNRWADVTHELLLPFSEPIRIAVDGRCEINDFVISDISAKYGGYFILCIVPIDCAHEIGIWRSQQIVIQSCKGKSPRSKRAKMDDANK
jgi:hypothetical protein